MQSRDYATLMAEYNQWMNRKIYELCSALPDDDYRRDLGAFFGSIHRTLNHIVWCDQLFMARLLGERATIGEPGRIIHDQLPALRQERAHLDERILHWARDLEAADLEAPFIISDDTGRSVPTYVIAVQMFNHQTHHRGQVTAMLTRLGVDPGATDIPAMPYFGQLGT